MRPTAFVLGLILIVTILWEVFETLILPRRVQRKFRITRFFYIATWIPWRKIGSSTKRKNLRETLLGIYGPASLLFLFAVWAVFLVFGYGVVLWGAHSPLGVPSNLNAGLGADIYLSASTFFTLGLGDVVPRTELSRFVTMMEAGNGLAFFAIVISYLPTLYGAFSRREVNISLLDARAGSPATAGELLKRYAANEGLDKLAGLLANWEIWAAELMESHISYPALCYFRSQHSNQSWVSALTAILDTCSLVMAGLDGVPRWQAQLTFAMARHALVDIAQIFSRAPTAMTVDRLPPAEFAKLKAELAQVNVTLGTDADACARLRETRDRYEPYAYALGRFLAMPLPPWSKPIGSKDNWMTSAWKMIH